MAADYYNVLGVTRSATQDEIRKAYKKIARENHPDSKPGDAAAAERFKQAAEAYEVLGDAEKRKKYDQFGEHWKHADQLGGNPFAGAQGGGPVDLNDLFGGQGVDLGDLFGGAFGGGGGRRPRPRSRRGSDVEDTIRIPFQLAASGGTYDITLRKESGTETYGLKIPVGINDGEKLRIAGQGMPGMGGGPAGDVIVTVRVAPHPFFRREGDHVLLDLPISVA
ncbi:MAG: J domain-containing protein, partial [Planctomycetaceae bacterium]|nr:J domain-containing protein [Planctomycetaceae bacterium]